MRFLIIGLFTATLATFVTCFQQVHARPNAYQTLACQELLRGLLARPDTLKVGLVDVIDKEKAANDEGSVIIYFTAVDKYAKEVESKAFCSVEDRASASIMDIQHVDHMKP